MSTAADKSRLERQRALSRGAATVIPIILTAIVGYVTWVYVVLLCAHHLIHPSPSAPSLVRRRLTAGIVLIVFYFWLLAFMGLCYIRLLYVVRTNPGYLQRDEDGEKPGAYHQTGSDRPQARPTMRLPGPCVEKPANPAPAESAQTQLDERAILTGLITPPPGLDRFFSRQVFVCMPTGLPPWCAACKSWKEDRAHHCSETGRCVRRMDHYCPWIGGIVSETSFKFFVQFVFHAFVFTAYVLVTLAIFIAEARAKSVPVNVHWYVGLGLAAVFCLFTLGMSGSSGHLVLRNLTTIESINCAGRSYHLAVHIAPSSTTTRPLETSAPTSYFHTIVYPFSPTLQRSGQPVASGPGPQPTSRTFVVVQTSPGDRPWDLGWRQNLRSIMGRYWWEWLLPVAYSPYLEHDKCGSVFPFGPALSWALSNVGLEEASSSGVAP